MHVMQILDAMERLRVRSEIGQSRLGFGCAALPGSLTRAESIVLLESALDCGVRHIDVAPMYDDGRAEAIVGAVAVRRRGEMIIVTKAGIAPPTATGRALRKLGLGGGPRFGQFSPLQVRASVERSLRTLCTDYLDALLLHECTPQQISDELKDALRKLQNEGKVRRFGLACTPDVTATIAAEHPDLADVIQVEASAASTRGGALILHSVLGQRLAALMDLLRDPTIAAQFSGAVNIDACDRDAIAALLLRDAMSRADVALFASSNVARVRSNAAIAAAPVNAHSLSAFSDFVNHALSAYSGHITPPTRSPRSPLPSRVFGL